MNFKSKEPLILAVTTFPIALIMFTVMCFYPKLVTQFSHYIIFYSMWTLIAGLFALAICLFVVNMKLFKPYFIIKCSIIASCTGFSGLCIGYYPKYLNFILSMF